MDADTRNEFAWLTSESAEEHLAVAIRHFEKNLNPLKTAKLLRKSISPPRAAMVMEQAQLRIRARRKFENADSMFFTGRSLEQSSSLLLATYKAKRFRNTKKLVDVCCGIGGDLIALAHRQAAQPDFETVGIDIDTVAAHFAAANLTATAAPNCRVENTSFANFDLSEFDGIHIDPDRRIKGRTTVGHFFEPSISEIFERLSLDRQQVAIKVAPATDFENPGFPVERQWIGEWRECKQQVLWAGPEIQENTSVATVVAKDGARRHFRFPDSLTLPRIPKITDEIGPYLYEPHPSVLAASLGVAIADKYSLQALSRGIAYLNSEVILDGVEPLLKGYLVEHVMPLDLKNIQKELKKLEVGQLTIKKRGVDQVMADKVSRLKLSGDQKATIILTRHNKSRRAILVSRIVISQS